MGKMKNEMRKIHAKKERKAKELLKTYRKREIAHGKLNALSKRILKKQQRKQAK